MYATSIKDDLLEKIVLSHKTYPDLEVYKAVAMSAAFPILFEPIFYDNKCIIDGGLLNNFPINDCLEINKNKDEILGVNLISGDTNSFKLLSLEDLIMLDKDMAAMGLNELSTR